MKKNLLIMLLLIALTSLLLAEDIKLQEITLDELLSDYLPDYKLEKQIQLEGIGRDFAVAKDTGEIVVVTEIRNNFRVYYLDKVGNLIWEKEYEFAGKTLQCLISDDGSAIAIRYFKSSSTINILFDNYGNVLFEKSLRSMYLQPTPDGQYFYQMLGVMGGKKKGIHIYDRSGKELKLIGYDFSKETRIRPVFLNNDKVIAYMDTKISFFDFDSGKFALYSEYQLESHHNFNDYFQQGICFNKKFIMVSSLSILSSSFLFDYNGNLINKYPGYNSVTFINEDEIIIGGSSRNESYVKRINLEENKVMTYNFPLTISEFFNSTVDLGNFFTISRNFYEAERNSPTSFIFDKGKETAIFGFPEFVKSSKKNIVFLNLNNHTCNISIMEVKNEN